VPQLHGSLQGLALRHHLVRQPDPERLLGVHRPAGDDHLHGPAIADGEGQPDIHPVAADDVPPPLQRPEHGVLGGDPDVCK
jgi:hypothetical protein